MFDAVDGPGDGVAVAYGNAEGTGDFAVIIAEQWEVERVLALEESQAVGLIATDSYDFGSDLLQVGEFIAEKAGLSGAAIGERCWIEEDDDVFFADKIFRFPQCAIVLMPLEAGSGIAFSEAVWAVGRVCEEETTVDSG
jgi:hypothetical protein